MSHSSAERLLAILDAASRVRVLVVGDVMLDTYLRGSVTRVSPEAPVPIVNVSEERSSLGGAANVAMNVAALGAACDLVGATGADAAGEEVASLLAAAGITADGLCRWPDRPTTVKTRIMAGHHQVARFDREVADDVDGRRAGELVERIEALAPRADVLVIEDYDKGVLARPVTRRVVELARELGRPLVVDPKARHFFDFGGCTVLKPNRAELAAAIRQPVPAEDPEALERIRRRLGCRNLLVTLGEQGMALAPEEGEPLRIPSTARSVYDVSGAGDTVTAVVAVALAAGATVAEAAVLANYAAGIEVAKSGVATVSAEELAAVLAAPDAPAVPAKEW